MSTWSPFRATLLRQGFGGAGTRNFCPSCQAKRAALFAEKLQDEILAPVPHRHVVFTIPKALRGMFERERPTGCSKEAAGSCR